MVWGENGVFTTTTGETINAGDTFKYFRVLVDRGIGADGIHQEISLATEVGRNTFDGTISQMVDTPVWHEAIDVFAPPEGTFQGVPIAVAGEQGIGAARD